MFAVSDDVNDPPRFQILYTLLVKHSKSITSLLFPLNRRHYCSENIRIYIQYILSTVHSCHGVMDCFWLCTTFIL